MADTGVKAPTTAASTAEGAWADNGWLNQNNIFGAGEAEVSAASFDAGDQTYVLRAQGFDFSAIPDGATIDGVQVVINARYATVIVSIDLCMLLDATGALQGDNKYATPQDLTTSAADYTVGGATDKWGATLDASIVKNANFGVGIGCLAGGSGNTNNDVYIDSITMQVWYTAAAPAPKIGDSVGVTDSTKQTKQMIRGLSESEGVTDAVLRTVTLRRAVGDTIGVSDGMASESSSPQQFDRTPGDSMGMSDVVVRRMTIVRGVES